MAGLLDRARKIVDSGTGWVSEKVGPAVPPELRGKLEAIGGILRMFNPAVTYNDYMESMRKGNYGEAALNAVGLIPGEAVAAGAAKLAALPLIPAAARAVRGKTEAKFPQYAEHYPEAGPPTWEIDKKSGEGYWAKKLTPEAEEFKKERARIAKDMEKNGYDPHFNPAERFYADPTQYPPNTNTLDIVPKKQATIDKDMAQIGAPEARARLQEAYGRGAGMPNTTDWYAMGQLEKAFIDELGPAAGREAFKNKFATGMAATTGGADPTSNLLMSQYGNYLRANNLPYPAAAHEMPFPIGGRYATGNMEMHKKVFDQGGFSALGETNPKRHNFAQDFMGNRSAATMDEQMTSGMTPGINMPPPGKYGLYEQVLHDEAAKAGVPPANFQDVAWAGFKNAKDPKYTAGQPMIDVVNEAIERTHRLTGMDRGEIVRRGLVRGEIPIYGAAGLLSLAGLWPREGEQ